MMDQWIEDDIIRKWILPFFFLSDELLSYFRNNRRSKAPEDDPENVSSQSEEIFSECEKLKQTILSLPNGKPDIWYYRQELLDQYGQLILIDLDYALEKKIEHDLWTIVFKNEINFKQEQLKENNHPQSKRVEIQASLQTLYEYARGYYMKLLQVSLIILNDFIYDIIRMLFIRIIFVLRYVN